MNKNDVIQMHDLDNLLICESLHDLAYMTCLPKVVATCDQVGYEPLHFATNRIRIFLYSWRAHSVFGIWCGGPKWHRVAHTCTNAMVAYTYSFTPLGSMIRHSILTLLCYITIMVICFLLVDITLMSKSKIPSRGTLVMEVARMLVIDPWHV